MKEVIDYADNPDKTTERRYLDDDLAAALEYAENDSKIDCRMYVSGINCPTKRAYQHMMATNQRYGKLGGNVAYHGYQSFVSGEVTLEEAHINTDTYKQALDNEIQLTGNEIADEYIKATNRVLMILAKQQIKLAFEQSQKEVDDLHNRTSEGIKTAKIAGKQIGRAAGSTVTTKKSVEAKAVILKYSRDFNDHLNDVEVMQMIRKIARNSYYKYKRELQAEQ